MGFGICYQLMVVCCCWNFSVGSLFQFQLLVLIFLMMMKVFLGGLFSICCSSFVVLWISVVFLFVVMEFVFGCVFLWVIWMVMMGMVLCFCLVVGVLVVVYVQDFVGDEVCVVEVEYCIYDVIDFVYVVYWVQ